MPVFIPIKAGRSIKTGREKYPARLSYDLFVLLGYLEKGSLGERNLNSGYSLPFFCIYGGEYRQYELK